MKIENAKIRVLQKEEPARAENHLKRFSVYNESFTGEYYYISLEKLIPYNKQARIHFDEESLNSLAHTIKQHGIRQPLTILPLEEREGFYEVISGERRLRAAKIAGLDKVPCIIIHDKLKAEEISIIENLHREDLHPIELGEAYSQLIVSGICSSQNEICEKLSVPKSKVSELISLTELPLEIKHSLVKNKLSQRQLLREVSSAKSANDMFNIISAFMNSNPLDKSTTSLSPSISTQRKSIFHAYVSDTGFHINKRGLKFLSDDQKKILKTQLMEVINIL